MPMAPSLEVEDLPELPAHGGIVGMCFHEWGHEVPPFPDDWMVRQLGGPVVRSLLLHRKQSEGGFVEEDRVVGDTGGPDCGGQLRPDGIVPALVFIGVAWLELHFECDSGHDYVGPRGAAGSSAGIDP